MKFLNLVVPLFLFLLAGCQEDPFGGDYTTSKPDLNDVAGTYFLKQQTINEARMNRSDLEANITLNKDGTFILSDLPNLLRDTGKYVSAKGTITAKGKWNIGVVGEIDNGLYTRKRWGIILDQAPDDLSVIGLMDDSSPYRLIIGTDDPDLGKAIIFSKK